MNYFSSRFRALSIAPSWGSVRQHFIYISLVTQLSFNVNRDSVNCSQRIARANANVGGTRARRNASATMTRNNRGVFLISIAAQRGLSRSVRALTQNTRESALLKLRRPRFHADTGAPVKLRSRPLPLTRFSLFLDKSHLHNSAARKTTRRVLAHGVRMAQE